VVNTGKAVDERRIWREG